MADAPTSAVLADPYQWNGQVTLGLDPQFCTTSRPLRVDLMPDEARLLALKLIRLADEAERA